MSAKTMHMVYWFNFINGYTIYGKPIIVTHPSKGVSLRDAEDKLRKEFPHATYIGTIKSQPKE